MGKMAKFWRNLFTEDGMYIGTSGISIEPDWYTRDPKSCEISENIQKLWDERVDKQGKSRPQKEPEITA